MTEETNDLPAELNALVGEWRSEATHPAMPGVIVRGTATFEWLGEGKFLVQRSENDHPKFPNGISVIGRTDGLRMHYFDDRGVHRLFKVTTAPSKVSFELIRQGSGQEFAAGDPGFWQRIDLRVEDGGKKIAGLARMSRDNVRWDDDLAITYWRR